MYLPGIKHYPRLWLLASSPFCSSLSPSPSSSLSRDGSCEVSKGDFFEAIKDLGVDRVESSGGNTGNSEEDVVGGNKEPMPGSVVENCRVVSCVHVETDGCLKVNLDIRISERS